MDKKTQIMRPTLSPTDMRITCGSDNDKEKSDCVLIVASSEISTVGAIVGAAVVVVVAMTGAKDPIPILLVLVLVGLSVGSNHSRQTP